MISNKRISIYLPPQIPLRVHSNTNVTLYVSEKGHRDKGTERADGYIEKSPERTCLDKVNPPHSRGMSLSLQLKRLQAKLHVCLISSAALSYQPGAPWPLGASQEQHATCSASLPPPRPTPHPLSRSSPPCTSESYLPTCLRGTQTHPAHRSSLIARSHSRAGLHRSTDGAAACPAATPEEGGIYIAFGPLFSRHRLKTPRQVVFALFSPTCRHVALFHLYGFITEIPPPPARGSEDNYLSGERERCAMVSRRGTQVKSGRGFPLKASPVFIVGVIVIVMIMCIYLDMMMILPW